jgi:Leucine-rich repeat (LRR) protein
LAKLTALQVLGVQNTKLQDRHAVALCASGLPHLTRLEELHLRGNQLCSEARTVLAGTARSLPLLKSIRILNHYEEPVVRAEQKALMARLNHLAERRVFE